MIIYQVYDGKRREKDCILQLKSLDEDQREFLITGVTPAGWAKLNGGFSVPAKP
mgnify:CR=1 FL=1